MNKVTYRRWLKWVIVLFVILTTSAAIAGIWDFWARPHPPIAFNSSRESTAQQETASDSERIQFSKQNKLPTEIANILKQADRFVLYSLMPAKVKESNNRELFHDYLVLGKTEIQDRALRDKLLRALFKGIDESDGSVAACFNPRHGIRATRDGETADLVICFECLQIHVHATSGKRVLTSKSPQPKFDEVLKKAGVPLAEEPH